MPIKNRISATIKSQPITVYRVKRGIRKKIIGPLLSPWRKGQVVMFHIGRSGSTVLSDLLTQRSDMYWEGEIYERFFRRFPYDGVPKDLQLKTDSFIKSHLRYSGENYYGFEVKFFHLRLCHETLENFITTLESLNFQKFIVLKRENYLRKIVSSIIAHQSTKFLAAGEKARLKKTEVDVNRVFIDRETKPLITFLEDYDADFAKLDKLLREKQVLQLTYETDVEPDPQIGYKRICNFMNLTNQSTSVRFSKTNPFPLQDIITNFKDVEQVLHNTKFEWMLNG